MDKIKKFPFILIGLALLAVLISTGMTLPEGHTYVPASAPSDKFLSTTTITVSSTNDNDDVEESTSENIYYYRSDIGLVDNICDQGANHILGLRFQSTSIPQGALITSAYLQFEVDESTSVASSLTIEGHAHDDAPAFNASPHNVSGRSPTTSVSWKNVSRQTIGDATQRSPNISAIVQEIVNRSGWSSGNDMAFMITGIGECVADMYNVYSSSPPNLVITYLESRSSLSPAVCIHNGSSSDVPISIDANTVNTITSDLVINQNGTVSDINLTGLNISHTYINDLEVTLESPSGTRVKVIDNICGGQNNIIVGLDDEASNSSFPCPPTSGADYQPDNLLSAFDGEEMNGTWHLEIYDYYAADGGSLNSWGLEITYNCTELCNDGIDNDGDGDIDCDDADCDGITVYAQAVTSQTGVTNASYALGSQDGAGAELYDATDILVLDLGVEISAGTAYTFRWRRKPSYSNVETANFVIEESTDATNWTTHPTVPGTSSQSWTTTTVNANVDTRYLRLQTETGSNDDFDLDEVELVLDCDLPCDIDAGIITSPNMDCSNNNPGLISSSVDAFATCNILDNHEFDQGLNSWILSNNDAGASSTASIDNTGQLSGTNSAHIDITSITGTGWHIEFFQEPFTTSSTESYDISFDAKADANRTLYVAVQLRQSPWTEYWSTTVNLTTSPQHFSFDGISIPYNSSNMGLMFKLGTSATDVNIDNVYFGINGCNAPAIVYKWQKREFISGSWTSWSDISGATSVTYDPPAIAYDTEYRRLAQVTGCDTWTASNVVQALNCAEICDDGLDNDGDGDVDCIDSDCPFQITASADASICNGDTVSISGFGADHYYWSTQEYTQAISVSPATTTSYTVTGYSEIDPSRRLVTLSNFDAQSFTLINATWGSTWGPADSLFNDVDEQNGGDTYHAFRAIDNQDWGVSYDLGSAHLIEDLTFDRRDTWSGRAQGGVFQIFHNGTKVYESNVLSGPGVDYISATPSPNVIGDEIRYIFLNGANTLSNDNVFNLTEWIIDGKLLCSDTEEVVVTVLPDPVINSVSTTPPANCPILDNGSITINASGSNLEYSIDGGVTYQSSNVFNNLSSGAYTLEVRNTSSGCTTEYDSNDITLSDPPCIEICDNGIDDDGDGDTDCDDTDCLPIIADVSYSNPQACPSLDDGNITISATGTDLEFSIDNGATYQSSSSFSGLTAGSYDVIVRSSTSLCSTTYIDNPIVILSKVCVEICDNNVDDDGDGLVDCNDSDCQPSVTVSADDTDICPGETITITSEVCENYPSVSETRPFGNSGWANSIGAGGSGITEDGILCFSLADTEGSSVQMFGLDSDPAASDHWNTIDFGMYITRRTDVDRYQVYIRENGVNLFTAYNSATSIVDVQLCIQRTGTTIEYLIDGSVVYTSSVASTGTLYYDNSIYSSTTHAIYSGGYSYFKDISLCSTPDMAYSWSTSETIDSIDVTSSGNYTVTVTDHNGCTASSSISIIDDTCIEICDDGLDNDFDGDIDCDDSDCGPDITGLTYSHADGCPNNDDGSITITATGDNLLYSIDNGVTYQTSSTFTTLPAGTYYIVVANSITGCNTPWNTNPIVLQAPACVELCDDGIDNDGDGLIDCADNDCIPSVLLSAEDNDICIGETITLQTYICEPYESISALRPLANNGWDNSIDVGGSGISGDGELCFTLSDFYLSSLQTIGLNTDPSTDQNYTSIDYGMHIAIRPDINTYSIQIRENGTLANVAYNSSASLLGSTFCIRRSSSTIEYLLDGSVIYTSAISSSGTLYYDNSLYSSASGQYLDGYSYFTDIELCDTDGINYLWNDGSTTDSLVATTHGIYSVTVTDHHGCTASDDITLNEDTCIEICDDGIDNDYDGDIDCADVDCGQPAIDSLVVTDPDNCYSLNNGTITIYATGANLEYSIDNGVSFETTNSFTNLEPGTYQIIVHNSVSGCSVTYPSSTQLNVTACPELCGDGIDNDLDGDIDCDDSDCGTPTYNNVGVTEIDDCEDFNNGQIAIIVTSTGGVVEYSIDGGLNYQTSGTFTGLTPGNYNINIRYQNSPCTLDYPSNPVTVSVDDNCPEYCADGIDNDGDGDVDCDDIECIPVFTSVNISNPNNCPSLNNGFIHIEMEGPDGLFEYSIDGGAFYSSNSNFNGLAAGTYNVRVRYQSSLCYVDYPSNPIILTNEACTEICDDGIDNDADGLVDCDDPDCGAPSISNVSTTAPDNCPILDNGSITITASGDNLQYSIDGGTTLQSSNTFSGLSNGNYAVIVINNGTGCSTTYPSNPVVLLDPPCPEICDDGIDNDGDGDIDCDDSACGQPTINSVNVANPDNCPSLNNGVIIIDATGPNLEFSIDDGVTYQASNNFTSLSAGNYTVKVRNSTTLCEQSYANNDVILVDPVCVEICGDGIDNDGDGDTDCDDDDCETPSIVSVITQNPDNCPDLDNGYIYIFASGDNKEYSINGGSTYQSSYQFTNLSAGNYFIRVRNTDSGCHVDHTVTITLTDPVCIEICGNGIDDDGDGNADCDDPDCEAPAFVSVSSTLATNCPDQDNASITITASGNNLQYSIDNGVSYQTSNTFTNLSPGEYQLYVKNSNTGCEVEYNFNPYVVGAEECLEICNDNIDNDGDGDIDCDDADCAGGEVVSVDATDPNNCPTLNNGAITINATGDGLEYSITNGVIYQNSPIFTGLYNGSFTIRVRNILTGCTFTYANNPVVLQDPECGEICNDNIDNDGDGLLDCDDPDCGVPTDVNEDHTDPDNCYALNNGNILLSSVGQNVEYSIDNGNTWQSDPSFDNLVAGTYYTRARNSETGCEAIGPTVTLYNSTCNEICDDGIDNDGDGLIDCQDGNCGAPTIGLVTGYDPYNCPTLDNGSITITGSGNDLQFSIDGGASYHNQSVFNNLSAGFYNVQLINTETGCVTAYPNNPLELVDPICGEICDNGIDDDGDGDIDCEDSECVNASNTYKIDFDIDTPVFTKLSDKVAIAEGNVLYAIDNSDAGFNYVIAMSIEGGPAGGSAVSFPSGAVLQESEFNTDDPSLVYNGGMTAIDLDLKGRKNISGAYHYYRDNTTNMSVNLYLDNGQALSNITYTIVDIDMDFTGSNYNFSGSYIDQVQILSGAGTNIITPYNSNKVKVTGDVARANFTDANNNNVPDQHEFIQAQTFDPSGNITVNTPGTISNISFVYSDFNLSIEGDPETYHDFDSGNQRVGLGQIITFESGCQVIEICDDSIDNDGDGDFDCDDIDCNPVITFISATDTDNCPLLDNGTISISAVGTDLEFSVDNGVTYQSAPFFSGLVAGSYNIVVRNTLTGCTSDYAFNPIIIEDPICIEICDDGIDNDGDGLTDCEDPDCAPGTITNISIVDPSNCPENDNGQITITASNPDLEYSIDGGVTWQSSNVFSNLPARNYTVVIRTTVGSCFGGYANNPVVLQPSNCPCVGEDYLFAANFENTSNDNSWTFISNASDGNFEIGTPYPYSSTGNSSTLMEIVAYRGTDDLLTGNNNSQDLDGGPTTAISRDIILDAQVTDIDLTLQYYFSHIRNSSSSDYMRIEIVDADTDNVLSTLISEQGAPTDRNAVWTELNSDLTSLAGSTIYIRVIAEDAAGGSKLEVAVDDILISSTPDVSLTISDINVCDDEDPIILSGGLPLGGVYSGPGVVGGVAFDPSLVGAGTYTITYTYTSSDGCDITATDDIIVGETNISISATASEICLNESTTITATGADGTSPYTYDWSDGLGSGASHTVSPTTNTQYHVTVTDAYGCTAATFINITVNQPPNASVSVSGSLCFDGSTQLQGSASGGTPGYTYAYSSPNGFSSTDQNPTVPSAGTYFLTVTDSEGCTDTASITVLDPFDASVSADDDELCYGESTVLTASPAGLTYQWDVFAGSATTPSVSVTPFITTDYSVTVTDANGCTSSTSITVTVNESPTISISADDTYVCASDPVNLSATVTNAPVGMNYIYTWSSGENTPSISVSPMSTGYYVVTVVDENSCIAIDSIEINVDDAALENVALGSNVDCDGSCTGEISIDADYAVTGPFSVQYTYSGVTYTVGPYDFGTQPDTAIVIGNLCAGSYTNITLVSQGSGCTDTWSENITISESHADWEHVNFTSDVSDCLGSCDGSFTVDANLGVTGDFNISYTYEGNVITDGPYSFAGDILIDNLCAGIYSDITITSLETGCQDIWPTNVVIDTPGPEASIVAEVEDDCQIGEGAITLNVSGGQYPYIIYWKNEDGTETGQDTLNFHGNITIYGLTGNTTYCFEVVDDNGCDTSN